MDFSALLLSTGVVALAEMGDKTQLLSLMLAARYPKQALPIIAGVVTLIDSVIVNTPSEWASLPV